MTEYEVKVATDVARKVSIASHAIKSIRHDLFNVDSLYLEHKMLIGIADMLDNIEQSVTEKINTGCSNDD